MHLPNPPPGAMVASQTETSQSDFKQKATQYVMLDDTIRDAGKELKRLRKTKNDLAEWLVVHMQKYKLTMLTLNESETTLFLTFKKRRVNPYKKDTFLGIVADMPEQMAKNALITKLEKFSERPAEEGSPVLRRRKITKVVNYPPGVKKSLGKRKRTL
jgi:hypothetical protein